MKIQSQTILYFILMFVGASGFFLTLFMERPQGFYAFVVAAAIGGLGVALNIWNTKRGEGDLVCPTGSNCNVVVNSKYSKFFGIPLEYLGILYFLTIISAYIVLIFAPHLLYGNRLIALAILTVGAALFSCYLIFIQAVLLRAWCIWCILASFLSLTVFFMSLVSLPDWTALLANYTGAIEMFQFLGYALGLGSLTSAGFLFFNDFIKDRDINERESDTLKGFSELVWFGFGLVIISQLAFYITNPDTLMQSGVFVARVVALLISAFAGAVLMIIFSPFLMYIPFEDEPANGESPEGPKVSWLAGVRKPIFVIGAIAVSSWYFAFVTNFIPEYGLDKMLVSYGMVLVAASTVGLLWEDIISSRRSV